jgi:hypothetical protein
MSSNRKPQRTGGMARPLSPDTSTMTPKSGMMLFLRLVGDRRNATTAQWKRSGCDTGGENHDAV